MKTGRPKGLTNIRLRALKPVVLADVVNNPKVPYRAIAEKHGLRHDLVKTWAREAGISRRGKNWEFAVRARKEGQLARIRELQQKVERDLVTMREDWNKALRFGEQL